MNIPSNITADDIYKYAGLFQLKITGYPENTRIIVNKKHICQLTMPQTGEIHLSVCGKKDKCNKYIPLATLLGDSEIYNNQREFLNYIKEQKRLNNKFKTRLSLID